jgi:hypothetical protein
MNTVSDAHTRLSDKYAISALGWHSDTTDIEILLPPNFQPNMAEIENDTNEYWENLDWSRERPSIWRRTSRNQDPRIKPDLATIAADKDLEDSRKIKIETSHWLATFTRYMLHWLVAWTCYISMLYWLAALE